MKANTKYKAFQKMCAIVGRSETYISNKIRDKTKKGVQITISITNPTTGLEFIMMVSKSAMINNEYLVRLYENHQHGTIELMARKMIITKPARASPRREPGLSEIVGIIIIIAIAVGAGSAFYYATLDRVDTVTSENIVDVYGLRLIAFIPDDGITETDTVYAEMTVSLLYVETVSLGGDVQSVNSGGTVLFDNVGFTGTPLNPGENPIRYPCHDPKLDDNCQAVKSKDGVAIHYSGRLVLEEKKKIGDTVDIIVEYGEQSRTANAAVEGN